MTYLSSVRECSLMFVEGECFSLRVKVGKDEANEDFRLVELNGMIVCNIAYLSSYSLI